MDRTAVDGRGVPVNVALVWPGFRGWGLARPGVEAAIEKLGRVADPECGLMHGPRAARPILPLHRTAAARSSNGTGGPREPPADSKHLERRGDRSTSARLRVPHAGAGLHPSTSAPTKVLVGRVAGSGSDPDAEELTALRRYPGSAGLCDDGFPSRSERNPRTVGDRPPERAAADGPRGDGDRCCAARPPAFEFGVLARGWRAVGVAARPAGLCGGLEAPAGVMYVPVTRSTCRASATPTARRVTGSRPMWRMCRRRWGARRARLHAGRPFARWRCRDRACGAAAR